MESIRIDILNPKVKKLLKNLADLKLIRIKAEKTTLEFKDLLTELRSKSEKSPSLDELASEVKKERRVRNGN